MSQTPSECCAWAKNLAFSLLLDPLPSSIAPSALDPTLVILDFSPVALQHFLSKEGNNKTGKQTNNSNNRKYKQVQTSSLLQGRGSLFTAEFRAVQELLDDQPQTDDQQQHVAHGARKGGSSRGLLEELTQALLDVVHLVVDAEESEDMEKLVTVAYDVKEARLDALGDLAHIEEGGYHQPEVASVEVHEERGVLTS